MNLKANDLLKLCFDMILKEALLFRNQAIVKYANRNGRMLNGKYNRLNKDIAHH